MKFSAVQNNNTKKISTNLIKKNIYIYIHIPPFLDNTNVLSFVMYFREGIISIKITFSYPTETVQKLHEVYYIFKPKNNFTVMTRRKSGSQRDSFDISFPLHSCFFVSTLSRLLNSSCCFSFHSGFAFIRFNCPSLEMT